MSEYAHPAIDLGALTRRAAVPAAVAVAGLAVVLAVGPLRSFVDALGRALDAEPGWVAAAATCELLSFGGYATLLWLVGGRATSRLGLRASAQVTLGGSAATRLLPTAGVGGAALTLWALRRAGLGGRAATRTLLTFLVLLYSVFLGAMAAAGALLALGLAQGEGPVALSAVPAAAAGLALATALALAARGPATAQSEIGGVHGGTRSARARARVGGAAGVLGAAVRDALALVRSGDPRLLGALAWWAFDAAVLWAMLHAFGAPPPLAVVVLAYLVGQVGNTIPIPGAVSGGIVSVLVAFGVEADLALVSVLAYRAVAIWLPASIGLAALGGLRRTVAGWTREKAPRTPLPTSATPGPSPQGQARPRLPGPRACAAGGRHEPALGAGGDHNARRTTLPHGTLPAAGALAAARSPPSPRASSSRRTSRVHSPASRTRSAPGPKSSSPPWPFSRPGTSRASRSVVGSSGASCSPMRRAKATPPGRFIQTVRAVAPVLAGPPARACARSCPGA